MYKIGNYQHFSGCFWSSGCRQLACRSRSLCRLQTAETVACYYTFSMDFYHTIQSLSTYHSVYDRNREMSTYQAYINHRNTGRIALDHWSVIIEPSRTFNHWMCTILCKTRKNRKPIPISRYLKKTIPKTEPTFEKTEKIPKTDTD
mgnify:CR=1 FL=1